MGADVIKCQILPDGKDHQDQHISAISSLGAIKKALGKHDEAEKWFKDALAKGREHWGTTDPRYERLLRDTGSARELRKTMD